MKTYHKFFLTGFVLLSSTAIFAQTTNTPDTSQLVAEGKQLLKEKKPAEAADKFAEALKIDPVNTNTLFLEGFCLMVTGRHDEALPCFEKIIAVPNNIPMAYAYIGDIHSIKREYDKAIASYSKAVALMPRNPQVWYTLGLAYLQSGKPAQAQAAEAESIKINAHTANNQQIYAIAAFAQGKNAEALLAFASYLVSTSPKQSTAAESYRLLKLILKPNPKAAAIADPIAKMQQALLIKTAAAAIAGKANLTPVDSLSMQLTSVFKAIKAQQDQYGSPFFSKYYGDYFATLAATENMDTFVHLIFWNQQPAEADTWIKDHSDNMKSLMAWLKDTKREME